MLTWTSKDNFELFGADTLSAVNVTYPEKLKARPEAFKEFNRMLHESVQYAVNNPDQVGAAIAKQTAKITADYFKAWLKDYSYFPGVVSEADKKGDDHGLDHVQGDGHFEKGARRQRRDLETRDHGVIRPRNS